MNLDLFGNESKKLEIYSKSSERFRLNTNNQHEQMKINITPRLE